MKEVPRTILIGWNVLVVDDEPDSLEVATMVLEAYGATVHAASNGKDALRLLAEVKPRFVISDLSMPVMDGWQLMEKIQRDGALREIPVIALTAHAMKGDREKALATGFHNYLTKPLTARTFIYDLLLLLVDIPEFAEALRY